MDRTTAPPRDDAMVSIVINNYDYDRFLPVAIDSALAQDHPRTEVIVVDDGSTDGSRDVIRGYGDRITPVLTANRGQAAALNGGFTTSRGDLILFLDADDVLYPSAAGAAVRAWRPGVAKVQFPLEVIDGEGRPFGARIPADPLRSGDLRGLVLSTGKYPCTGTTGNAFHRDVLARLLPIPEREWRLQPDSYLLLLAPFEGEIVSLDRVLGGYRDHGANKWTMARVDAGRLRQHLESDARKEEMLRPRLPAYGAELPRDWCLRSPRHVQVRLASLCLEPAQHPYPRDRRWTLALRGVRASWRNPVFSPRKRALFALWFLAVALLPRRWRRHVIRLGFQGWKRPAALRRLLGSD